MRVPCVVTGVQALNIEIKNGAAPDLFTCQVSVMSGTAGYMQMKYKCRVADAPKVGTKIELELPGL